VNALGVLLALVTQVVTVKAADVAEKPVYVRIGVGVESRLLMPEALVRLHGTKPAADLLGLKLGQARPQALLMFRPREATTGRFRFVGPTREMRLVIEASVLGQAQGVEFRVVDAEPAPEGAPEPVSAQAPKISALAPRAAPQAPTASSLALTTAAQAPGISSVAPTAAADTAQALTAPPVAPTQAPASSAQPPKISALTPTAASQAPTTSSLALTKARAASTQAPGISSVAPTAAADTAQALTAPPVAPTQAPAPSAQPPKISAQAPTTSSLALTPCAVSMAEPRDVTLRLRRRIGRPGQQAVFIEELRREGGRTALRLRVERGARVEIASLEVDGRPTTLTLDRERGDLVASAVLPDPTRPPRRATLVLAAGDRWTRTVLPLAPAVARLFQGGSS
jgi:hypothetical protein